MGLARSALALAVTFALGAAAIALNTAPASAADEVVEIPASGVWQVEGRGYGHGIGMSQWGAQAAALQGLSAEQILDFYYPGTIRFDIGQDYPLRVRLLSLAGPTLTAGPIPGAGVVITDLATGNSVPAPIGARVKVTKSAAGFGLATMQGGVETPLALSGGSVVVGPVRISGSGGTQVWTYKATGAGVRYVGTLVATATGAATLELVNHVPMEQYLRGVVPRESPSSWEPAALQAQAVAARTYALAVRQTSGTADICDTTACQVYGGAATLSTAGVASESHAARTDAAIAATARVARYYGGGPAFTQFSSSNGGFSKAGSRPYLVAAADPYTGNAPNDSVSRWTDTLSVAAVQKSCPTGGTLRQMVLHRTGAGDLGGRITSATLECSSGTSTVYSPAFGLKSSWWRPTSTTSSNPFGNLEVVQGTPGGIRLVGWAIDPDSANAIDVRVSFSGATQLLHADVVRSDVGAVFPASGARHGFAVTFPSAPGNVHVCVEAVNIGAGVDTPFGCSDIVVPVGAPYGSVDAAVGNPGRNGAGPGITVRGWAVDPDAGTGSIQVQVLVDGVAAGAAAANDSRADVGAALPGMGAFHGFTASVVASPGSHEICVLAVNEPAGPNPSLGCRVVEVPGGSPVGMLEVGAGVPGGIEIVGWAVDPDTADPGYVWVDVSGAGSPVRAEVVRTDIGAAYPGYGSAHGYRAVVPATAGAHRMCVTAVNVGVGRDVALGCRDVTVPASSPIGHVDTVTAVPGGVAVRGWALDPKSGAVPSFVWIDEGGAGRPARADRSRPDIGAAFPSAGDLHGFGVVLPTSPGSKSVCVTAINTGVGANTALGCRLVTVRGGSPSGMIDSVRVVPGGIEIAGWALDPDVADSGYVWVDVAGAGRPVLANRDRPDIGAAFVGYGNLHGYRAVVPVAPGGQRVCVTAVNAGPGSDTVLGCQTVIVPG